MPAELTEAVRAWAARQPDRPAQSEAFRRLVEVGIAASTSFSPRSKKTRDDAAHLAGEALDRYADQSATAEEQDKRKRRLLKGPKEFRALRKDHN